MKKIKKMKKRNRSRSQKRRYSQKNDGVVDPNGNEIDIEEEIRTQKIIDTCLELLEKKQNEDEQDQNEK